MTKIKPATVILKEADILPKKLTATLRVTYEGHKNAVEKTPIAHTRLAQKNTLGVCGQHCINTPEKYIKKITIEEDIALAHFLQKIITLGSSQGFVAFMMLYQYMYDKNLLGKEIPIITGQEIINHIYDERAYKLKAKNRQTLLSSIIQLSGLKFCIESWELTQNIQQERGFENNTAYKHFTLLKVDSHTQDADKNITSIRGVSIMKDFINLWYKKMSRLYIPLEDILKIPHDHNGDHRRGFNLALALRHAELGIKNNAIEWDLQQCLNIGQWQVNPVRKTEAWKQIIESLEVGKKQQLIDYFFVYVPQKPIQLRYIQKVVIKRLWNIGKDNLVLGFKPENLKRQIKQNISI
jgi:hypothetical protein